MNATRERLATSWACYDCYAFMVNGDLPDDDDERAGVVRDSVVRVGVFYPGRAHGPSVCGHDHEDDHDEITECETKHFSRWSCDCCRSPLGGYRFAFTVDA